VDRFERRKEQKKESIRRAALELFQTYGFKKVTIGEIARKADVSPVTIFNHFGSKEELVRDVVKTLILNMLDSYRAVIESEQTFIEKLEFILFDKSEVARQYQGELVQTALSSDPEIQQFIEHIWQGKINQLMLDFYEEGKRQGYVNANLSQEGMLAYTAIFRSGLMANPGILSDMGHNTELFHELMSFYLYGLMGKVQ
jgi:AcrR family transcriptional regulator